jgi:Asp-tRNA(Asn)/Glu-tRNA(Gln) amidotransferase A subunit family amidase
MNEKTVVITEKDGTYQIQNNGISEFALLGILECIVFDMKSTRRNESTIEQKESPAKQNDSNSEQSETLEKSQEIQQETKREAVKESSAPDIRTRISNAVKAIRALGSRIEDTDLSNLTDEELQSELEELTEQYKRLKSSKASK